MQIIDYVKFFRLSGHFEEYENCNFFDLHILWRFSICL